MASPTSPTATRAPTNASIDEDAIPGEDTSEVTKLFSERLSAWKHAVAYLEDYVTATEKTQHAHGKEYERVLKVSRAGYIPPGGHANGSRPSKTP
jgi:hypothetical protein